MHLDVRKDRQVGRFVERHRGHDRRPGRIDIARQAHHPAARGLRIGREHKTGQWQAAVAALFHSPRKNGPHPVAIPDNSNAHRFRITEHLEPGIEPLETGKG